MNVALLIEELRKRDIHVRADGDDLQLNAPAGALTPAMRDHLRERKGEILAFLRAPTRLSSSQQRLYFLNELDRGGAAYVIADALELRGPLDAGLLGRALQGLVHRHESLRTVFVSVGGEPRQHVLEAIECPLPVVDLTADENRAQRLRQALREEGSRGFDLQEGPLFRARLYRMAGEEHVLLLAMHHIISDGWSLSVLARDLAELYAALARGEAPQLPRLRMQFRDYARWQGAWLQGDEVGGLVEHWRARLAGAPHVLELPTDRPRPADESYRGADHTCTLPRELSERLRKFAQMAGATLFMVLFAGFSTVLARHSGQRELLVGTPVANRNRPELQNQVGFFVNTLVLRANLTGEPSGRELLERVRDACLDAYAHQDLPFDQLVEAVKPERDLSRNPLFQVMFALQNTPARPLKMGGLAVRQIAVEHVAAQFDLSLDVYEEADGLRAVFNYCTDLFDEGTVARIADHWRRVLEAMLATPERSIWKLPLLSDEERRQVLGTPASVALAGPPLHEVFERQAEQSPESPAVICGGRVLSYRELDCRANQLAHALRKRGVRREVLVALCVERSPEMIVALLGVLKAGGAYVPLDPEYPAERLAHMLQDCRPRVLVATERALASLPPLPEETSALCLDRDASLLSAEPQSSPRSGVQPGDLAYAIYTSGSTGRPKAALLTHGGLSNLALSEYRLYGVGAMSRVLQFSSLSFDASLSEIALALCTGARLYLEPRERLPLGPELERYLDREKITVLSLTPSALAMLDPAAGNSIEQVIVGGEPCPAELAQRWAGRCRFFNTYGPTEATIVATYVEYRDGLGPPLIGRPLPNVSAYVLDEACEPVPVGVPGELYIGGVGVARGYLNRPQLSAERFVADPFGAPGALMYRSGDFVRRRADGQIEFIGRRDDQVKLRGFRIELGEIESAIASHPGVRQAAVVVREDQPGDKRLVAYVSGASDAGGLAEELRARLRVSLPEHMVPAHFVTLDALPLTPNGKTDRKALPKPAAAELAPGRAGWAAPRSDLEIGLATVWQKTLGVERVGLHDNFFDLGGNSLSVLKLVVEMERATGFKISLGEVFRAPTIAGLVEGRGPAASKAASMVVPLQPHGSGVPVFCICGINIYKAFAESLGNEQPVYGVFVAEEQAIVDQVIRGEKPVVSIERLVDAYYKAIARFMPDGPYRLAGLSFGGILAMELAAKMRAHGAQVDVVLLLDAALPQGLRRNWRKWLAYQATEVLKGNGVKKLRRLMTRLQSGIGSRSNGDERVRYVDEAFSVRQQAAFMAAAETWSKSETTYDFRAVLFRASDASMWGEYNDLDEDYGWRRYLGDQLQIVDAVGGHRSIIEPPNVADLGRKVRRYLTQAGKGADPA